MEKSRGAKMFARTALLIVTAPMLKVGGQNDFYYFMSDSNKRTVNDFI